ncbi:glutamate ABC transporter substrate-binding protein [Streptomyces sp. AA1529]|uniref:glutamate ABC transporter substrate-binding protein n=1 Tax=Streptomyces sp. AA1529 TaxID=1203257 RepID=UPI003D731350
MSETGATGATGAGAPDAPGARGAADAAGAAGAAGAADGRRAGDPRAAARAAATGVREGAVGGATGRDPRGATDRSPGCRPEPGRRSRRVLARGRPGGASRRPSAAAGGLAVAAAVLVAAVAGTGVPGGASADRGAARPGPGPGAAVVRPASATEPGAEPRPEKCADGSNPAESLKPSGASGKAVERIKKKDKLVVGVDQNSYLWGYRDPSTGTIEGFDIDLVKAIARDLLGKDGADRIVYRTIPTDQRVPAIQSGDVDMVVRTMTINCSRRAQVAFSTAYFQAGQQLVVPKKHARVKGFDSSMRGKHVCYAAGSTAERMMKTPAYAELGARPVVVPNQLDCLVRMQLGEADATVTDSALGAGQAAQDPSVELVGEPETLEPYGVAMNLEDEDLVRRVNKVLEDYREHKWKSSYDRWLADDMMGTEGKKPAPPEPLYRD